MRCVPVLANVTVGPFTPTPYPLSCQPHPDRPHPLQSSMLTIVASDVPIFHALALSNCTQTESLSHVFDVPLPRIQMRYGRPASAWKVISKYSVGAARGVAMRAAPAFGFCRRAP